jgi:ABC-type glycerol-3-phosphate transport system substrate-binding protein
MLTTMQLDAADALGGKIRVMPLPAWEPGGRRTSTVGGTAMFIPKGCPRVDEAWALAKFLYFDRESLVQRFRTQNIVPPLQTVYDDPVFDEPVAFFQGQRVGQLLTELAAEVPPVNGSPYSPEGFTLLHSVIPDVVAQRRSPGEALRAVAAELRALIARDAQVVEASRRGPQGEEQ